jgi:hypothetical protein
MPVQQIESHDIPDVVDDETYASDSRILERRIAEQAKDGIPRLGRFAPGFLVSAGRYLRHGDKPWTRRALNATAEIGAAMFLASGQDGPVSFTLEGKSIVGRGGASYMEEQPGTWQSVFHAANLVRNEQALKVVLDYPIERFRRVAPASEEFDLLIVETFKRFRLRDPSWRETAARLDVAAEPQNLRVATPRLLAPLRALVPIVAAIDTGDQARFTAACVEALKVHKATWTHGTSKTNPVGMLALGVAGLAAVGVDRGLKYEIESGYAPRWLVEGSAP